MYKYETSDIWKASALFSLNHRCKAERIGELANNRGKYLFIFEVETLEEETLIKTQINQINREELNVNLNNLYEKYKTLKNLTFK